MECVHVLATMVSVAAVLTLFYCLSVVATQYIFLVFVVKKGGKLSTRKTHGKSSLVKVQLYWGKRESKNYISMVYNDAQCTS